MLDLTKDYFELFSLPREYSLNGALLIERYLEFQRLLHPDVYAQASDLERRLSVQGAAFVNEAYTTLKDPLKRAVYLLQLFTNHVETEGNRQLSPGFLMEQIELHESLEQAKSSADPFGEIGKVTSEVRVRLEESAKRLTKLFAKPDAQALAEAQEAVSEMQFLEKLRVEAQRLEADIEDEEF